MSLLLAPIVSVYRLALAPVAPFTWIGLSVTSLDVVAIFRLCIALRQIKESLAAAHARKRSLVPVEERSYVRDLATVLTVVYGGEVLSSDPLLGVPPSFVASGVGPALYAGAQYIVNALPSVFSPSMSTEGPLAIVDAFTRAFLLTTLIPPSVVTHASPVLAASPWTLLLTSLITANGGFFVTNLFSFLEPTPLALTTPAEIQPYGWSSTDLWVAPLVTGGYALLTHAQPFWADAHSLLVDFLGAAAGTRNEDGSVKPLDPEVARAACAAFLAVMFSARAAKNFGYTQSVPKKLSKKSKTQ